MLNIAKLWHLYNETHLGHFDPVCLLPFFGDMLREMEKLRAEVALLRRLQAPPARIITREDSIRAEREKLQLPLFEEVSRA